MNLVLGILWLLGALGLFAYEAITGETPWRIRVMGNISGAWALVILAAWNFARWYSARMNRADQEAIRIVHEARLREARHHERPVVPDPTFDFTDRPAAHAPRPPGEQPPSSN
jgi:hypothetical protein